MQSSPSHSSRLPSFALVFGLLAAGCLLGACDRHRADEVPESYGHGSSHQKSFDRHQTDSRDGSRHFSDSKGFSRDEAHDESEPAPTAKPDGTVSGPMFPGSH